MGAGFRIQAILSLFLGSLALSGCCFNASGPGCTLNDSNLGDPGRAGVYASDPSASVNFAAAQRVIRNNCATCHTTFGNYTEAEWQTSGYITAGSSTTSLIYTRLRNAGLGGTENMPPSGALATSDRLAIKTWIDSISTGGGGTDGASQRLAAAMTVLNKNWPTAGNSCMGCHSVTKIATSSAYGGATVPAFGTYTTSTQFVANGLVVSGYPATSWLYRALRTHGDIATMPDSDPSSLSASEAATLSDWITNIDNP